MEKMPRIRVCGILKKNDELLFVKHIKKEKEYWLLPGGGVDYGETFQSSLRREFKEEVNLDIEVKEMLFISEAIAPDNTRHIVNMYFEVEQLGGELKLGEEDILKDAEYLKISDLDNHIIYPNIKKELKELYFGKVRKELRYLGNMWE